MPTDRPLAPDEAGDLPSATPARQPTDEASPAAGPLRWAEEPTSEQMPRARWWFRVAATVLVFVAAVLAALVIWAYYVTSPWTRDGTIRVQVASVAPQVTGQITELRVVDNQFVKKGDVLYVIDPFNFRVQLASAKATVKQQAADYQVKRVQAERLLSLNLAATTAQAQQAAVGAAEMAEGAFEEAQQQQEQAEVNLQRTRVTSPVNGFVTNLLMRVGDYADTGKPNVSIIDTDSYWIDGYFEETKLGRICVGDPVEAKLMGFGPPILGRVDTVTRGISVSNAAPSTQGLPSVNAVYTWVRLAQRVPVRVRITHVPPGIPLVSGLTATVTVRPGRAEDARAGFLGGVTSDLRDVFAQRPPSPDCIPATLGATGPEGQLPEAKASRPLTPEEINPGIAPGVAAKPSPQ